MVGCFRCEDDGQRNFGITLLLFVEKSWSMLKKRHSITLPSLVCKKKERTPPFLRPTDPSYISLT